MFYLILLVIALIVYLELLFETIGTVFELPKLFEKGEKFVIKDYEDGI